MTRFPCICWTGRSFSPAAEPSDEMGIDTVDNGRDVEILFDDVVDEATLEDFNNLKKNKMINDPRIIKDTKENIKHIKIIVQYFK